ncbi:MAG: hypothetical protein IT198_11740 [Acidimicrobiia bacterium]|nr:hypothetical protein [Acidimicrobiia bacterium]
MPELTLSRGDAVRECAFRGVGGSDVDGSAVGAFEGEGAVGVAFDLVAGFVHVAVMAGTEGCAVGGGGGAAFGPGDDVVDVEAGRAFAAGPAARDVAEADDA